MRNIRQNPRRYPGFAVVVVTGFEDHDFSECDIDSITIEETHTVDDIAMDALVMDESSSLSWFSFRAKVDSNFDPGRESFFR